MRVLFVVNDLTTFVPGQTTAMLVRAALIRGHGVWVAPFTALSVDRDGQVEVVASPIGTSRSPSVEAVVEAALTARTEVAPLASFDRILLRTNPGRLAVPRASHDLALALCGRVAASGVPVHNTPDGVRRAGSKLYLSELPAWVRPPTAITSDPTRLRAWVEAAEGRVVLKPLEGTRGRGVMALEGGTLEPSWPAVRALLDEGPVVVQPFVEGAEAGDTRVLVLDGEPLVVDGAFAAIGRVPAPGDFRSNLHAGGTAVPGEVTDGMRAAVERIAPRLRADGLRLVGVDFIADRIIELNVASPGGLRDAERFTGRDFSGAVMDRFLSSP